MANIIIKAPLVDGSLMPLISENNSCKEIVLFICGDDLRPPPSGVVISIKTESGKFVEIYIPDNSSSVAQVNIDGVLI